MQVERIINENPAGVFLGNKCMLEPRLLSACTAMMINVLILKVAFSLTPFPPWWGHPIFIALNPQAGLSSGKAMGVSEGLLPACWASRLQLIQARQ
jgi:hypothetical protein